MNFKPFSPVLLTLLFLSEATFPQDRAPGPDDVYGPDQTLYNGKKYSYFLPAGTKGHQYLVSPAFLPGSLTLRGAVYPGVSLNYDLFNQQVLLLCRDEWGGDYILQVSQAWLEGFSFDGRDFALMDPGQGETIYQVIGKGPVKILCTWRKTLTLEPDVGTSNYIFSPAIRESFLFMNGTPERFRSRRSFLRLVDPDLRHQVRTYLVRNRIRLSRASDQELAKLTTFMDAMK